MVVMTFMAFLHTLLIRANTQLMTYVPGEEKENGMYEELVVGETVEGTKTIN